MTLSYDRIGDGYDNSRTADATVLHHLADLLSIHPEGDYLDLACGTGNYTTGLHRMGGAWTALDRSPRMLARARRKSDRVEWVQGDAACLPFHEDSFDGAVCTLAIHHFEDLEGAFAEVARILRPRSRFVLFTATQDQMAGYWLNHYWPLMMAESIVRMPSLSRVAAALDQAGLKICVRRLFPIGPDHRDGFLYAGKHDPSFYLDEENRRGISSFRNLCENGELEEGLDKLRDDIRTGKFGEVAAKYAHEGGDYLFIKAVKI